MNKLKKASTNLYFNRLNEATQHLARLNESLSEGKDFSQAFLDTYKEVDLAVQESIDLTQTTLELCAQGVAHAKKQEQKYRDIRKSFERVSEKQKERLSSALQDGADLVGSEKEYFLAKSAPSVKSTFPLESKTITNILPGSLAENLPMEYLIKTTVYSANKKAIGEALKEGKEVPHFYLDTHKTHVRERDVK